MKKINLEEIMQEHVDAHCFERKGCQDAVISAMKEAVKQALALAAENAEADLVDSTDDSRGLIVIDRDSILNTINQIE